MTLPPVDAGRARDVVGRFAGLSVLVVFSKLHPSPHPGLGF